MKRLFLFSIALIASLVSTTALAAHYDIDCYDYSDDWYEGLWIDYSSPEQTVYNGWNIIMKGKGGENIIVCVLDRNNKGELVDGYSYTDADIVTDWTGIMLYGMGEDLSAETGIVYTQTHDNEGKLHVVLDMKGKSGDTYHVTYNEKCEMIGEAEELTFTDDQITLIDNTVSPGIRNFQVIAEIPGTVSMMICVKSDKIEGAYTIADVIPDYTDITWGDANTGEYSMLKFCDVDMKVTEDPELSGAYYYDITAITKVGRGYHTVLHTKPWEKPDIIITETKTITAANLRMMDFRESLGELLFIASSPEFSVNLYARSKEPQGTFTNKDIDLEYNYVWYYDEDGVERQTTAIDGEYTYTETADGSRSLIGWIDCMNGVKYELDLHYIHTQPTRTVELTISDAVIEDQRGPDGGGIIIQAETDDKYIVVGIYTPEIEGSYTEQDVDWQVTYIVELDKEDFDSEYMLELLDADISVKDSGDGENYNIEARMTMQAEMDKTDIVEYLLHLKAYVPNDVNGINNIYNNSEPRAKVRKVMRNGRIIIATDDNIYNVQGARLK